MDHPELLQAYRSRRNRRSMMETAHLVLSAVIALVLVVMMAASVRAETVEVGIGPGEELPQAEIVENVYQTIPISDSEFEELRWVLALEAHSEGLQGIQACCEVVFNRVLSPKWPNSVHEVLSQRGQFSTYKLIGSRKAWAVPGELEDDAISECLRSGPSGLPSMKYVYFDSKGGVNGRNTIKLGRHYFSREK